MLHTSAVREMAERVIELSRSYAIWWELVQASNFERFSQVIDDHEDYFAAITHSLFQAFVIISYQLFENRKDTTSLRSLVNDLEKSNPAVGFKLRSAIDEKLPLIKKVFSIRGNVYAHRNKLQAPEAFFASAGLSADHMREVLNLARDVVCALAEFANLETRADLEEEIRLREECSRDDTRIIMQALAKQALMKV
jgi:hypothetical protein